ncbi:hypothetical protein SESBI_42309 [Sesbania bispinosa]|nr:hypothetical protein SESBI_42309 [Sesbania bispinosa]
MDERHKLWMKSIKERSGSRRGIPHSTTTASSPASRRFLSVVVFNLPLRDEVCGGGSGFTVAATLRSSTF